MDSAARKAIIDSLFRSDGWVNLLAGLGKKQDKAQQSYWGSFEFLDDDQLGRLYTGEGFVKRIIKTPADDMIREWITIENDEDNFIMNKLNEIKAKTSCHEALLWMRLYGGAVIFVGAMDGNPPEEPLQENRVKSIEFLHVVDRSQIFLGTSDIAEDPRSKDFGQIEVYDLRIGPLNTQVRVHKSRILEFKGEPAPKRVGDLNTDIRYWGLSALQAMWEKIRDYGAGFQSVDNILLEFIIGKYKLKGLAEKLATNQENAIITRMDIVNVAKSMLNAVLLDADSEEYTRDTANVGGIADILDRLQMNLSGVSEIPVTRLFGRSPAGQNATGESDTLNYYDGISAQQENKLHDPLQDLVDLIAVVYNRPGDHPIAFNPLFQLTEQEQAEVDNKNAQTDQTYIQNSVLSEDEVRQMRFPDLVSTEV